MKAASACKGLAVFFMRKGILKQKFSAKHSFFCEAY